MRQCYERNSHTQDTRDTLLTNTDHLQMKYTMSQKTRHFSYYCNMGFKICYG